MNYKQLQDHEIWLIDLIEREGYRDGLSTMSEHPRYRELVNIQNVLYPDTNGGLCSEQFVFHNPNITKNIEVRVNGRQSGAK